MISRVTLVVHTNHLHQNGSESNGRPDAGFKKGPNYCKKSQATNLKALGLEQRQAGHHGWKESHPEWPDKIVGAKKINEKSQKSKALHLTEKCPFWRRFFHFFHPKWDVWNWRQKMAKFRKICKNFQKKANFRRQFFGLFFHGIHSQAGRMDESAIFFKKFAPKIGQMADFRAMWYCSTKERQCLLALWKVTPIFRVETRPRNNSAKAGYKCTF